MPVNVLKTLAEAAGMECFRRIHTDEDGALYDGEWRVHVTDNLTILLADALPYIADQLMTHLARRESVIDISIDHHLSSELCWFVEINTDSQRYKSGRSDILSEAICIAAGKALGVIE